MSQSAPRETLIQKRKRQWKEAWASPLYRWSLAALIAFFVAAESYSSYRERKMMDELLAEAGVSREEWDDIQALSGSYKSDEERIAEAAQTLCDATGEC